MSTDASMGRAEVNALNAAAKILRNGGDLPANVRQLLADLLRAEAAMFETLEPLIDLMNIAIESEGGSRAVIRVMKDDTGNVRLLNDNTNNAIRLAGAILNSNTEEAE